MNESITRHHEEYTGLQFLYKKIEIKARFKALL